MQREAKARRRSIGGLGRVSGRDRAARTAAVLGLAAALGPAVLARAEDPGTAVDDASASVATAAAPPVGGVGGAEPDLAEALPAPAEPLPAVSAPPTGIEILGQRIEPGEHRQVLLSLGESFAGMSLTTPVQVLNGQEAGPKVCLVAGIHGDEVVGIEVVRRVIDSLTVEGLRGAVIAIPIANPLGFRRSSRYLPDRRDLNRYFPGRPTGSTASRLAYRIFDQVIRHCQVLVDFHSGSFHRANLPQVRADLRNPQLLGMAQWFGVPVVVHSAGRVGTLRRAATDAGILAVLYEAGEPQRFDEESVTGAVLGTLSLLQTLGMIDGYAAPGDASDVFRGSHWIRAEAGGIFLSVRELGDWVTTGTRLGTVTDPFTNEQVVIEARRTGRIIGRALDQVVIPGYALYHVGTSSPGTDPDAEIEGEPVADEFEERPE
jgi:predicted deacylase